MSSPGSDHAPRDREEEGEWIVVPEGGEEDVRSVDDIEDDVDGSTANPPAPVRVVYQGGRYERLERLGAGAQGAVYRCVDTTTGEVLAVKELLVPTAQRDAQVRAMRVQKDTVGGGPHMMQVVDIFTEAVSEDGETHRVCTVMPYKGQGDLGRAIATAKRHYPEEAVLSLALQMIKALRYLHDKSIYHMDVKPDNILLDSPPADGDPAALRVSLTDFDSIRPCDRAVGDYDHTYAPPEVVEGAPNAVGPAADVFSLGLALFCLASLPQYPMLEDTMLCDGRWADPALLMTAVTRHFNKCSYDRNGVMVRYTSRLVELLAKMLAHDPAKRPTLDALEHSFSKLYEDLLTCMIVPELR